MAALRYTICVLVAFLSTMCSKPMVAQDYPSDFIVEVSGGSAGPTGGAAAIVVDSTGSGRAFLTSLRLEPEIPDGQTVEFSVSDSILAAVWAVIRPSDFFALDELYSNPDVDDGGFLRVRVRAGGRDHVVVAYNRYLPGLESIRNVVNTLAPDSLAVPGLEEFRRP